MRLRWVTRLRILLIILLGLVAATDVALFFLSFEVQQKGEGLGKEIHKAAARLQNLPSKAELMDLKERTAQLQAEPKALSFPERKEAGILKEKLLLWAQRSGVEVLSYHIEEGLKDLGGIHQPSWIYRLKLRGPPLCLANFLSRVQGVSPSPSFNSYQRICYQLFFSFITPLAKFVPSFYETSPALPQTVSVQGLQVTAEEKGWCMRIEVVVYYG